VSAEPWPAARVFYYSPERDALVLRGVAPLLRWLNDRSVRCYFAPHWRLGPHLRIAVAPGPEAQDLLRAGTAEFVLPQLRTAPSTTSTNPAALEAVHRQLAWDEQVVEPLTPLEPDNSVLMGREDDRSRVLGSVFADLVREFDIASWEHAIECYHQVQSGRSRFSLAFDLLASTASFAAPERQNPISGFGSMRMQAERLLVTASSPQEVRRHCDALYERLRARLAARLRAVVDGLPENDLAGPRWRALIEPRRDAAIELHRQGVRMPMASADPATWGRYADAARTSSLHMRTMGDPDHLARLAESEWHQGYRFAVNLCYLQLTRTGVTASQRMQLCHLLSRTATEMFGTGSRPRKTGA
jgi:hypothetical protein